MQADMRDVAFYFKKKTGVPRLTDSGLADVIVGGEGLSVSIFVLSFIAFSRRMYARRRQSRLYPQVKTNPPSSKCMTCTSRSTP